MPYVGNTAQKLVTADDVTVTDDLTVTDDASVGGILSIGTGSGTQPSYFHSFLNVQNNASTSSNASVTITSGSGGFAGLHFGDSDNGRIGQVAYNNSDNSLLFTANNSTRMTITSAGNVGMGLSAPTARLSLPAQASGDSGVARFSIESAVDSNDFTIAQYEDGTGTYTQIGQNISLTSGGNTAVLDSAHKTAGITFDGRGNGSLMFQTGAANANAERMRIDSAGLVGINTTSPISVLNVEATKTTALSSEAHFLTLGLTVDDDTAFDNAGVGGGIAFRGKRNTNGQMLVYGAIDVGKHNSAGDQFKGDLRFYTNQNSTGVPLERMRIDSDGLTHVGRTAAALNAQGVTLQPNGQSQFVTMGNDVKSMAVGSGNDVQLTVVEFLSGGEVRGSVSVTSSATAFNTSSDVRLKENIEDAKSSGSIIDQIQVREFDWKKSGEHQRYGMIAQELNEVAPETVTTDEVHKGDMWTVDYSKLVPMMMKEIQDLRKRLTVLEV